VTDLGPSGNSPSSPCRMWCCSRRRLLASTHLRAPHHDDAGARFWKPIGVSGWLRWDRPREKENGPRWLLPPRSWQCQTQVSDRQSNKSFTMGSASAFAWLESGCVKHVPCPANGEPGSKNRPAEATLTSRQLAGEVTQALR